MRIAEFPSGGYIEANGADINRNFEATTTPLPSGKEFVWDRIQGRFIPLGRIEPIQGLVHAQGVSPDDQLDAA